MIQRCYLASKAQLQDQLTSAKAESIALQSHAAFTGTKLETIIEEMGKSHSSETLKLILSSWMPMVLLLVPRNVM